MQISLPKKGVDEQTHLNGYFIGAVLLTTLVILFWASTLSPEHAFDDAYITYRYADNLRNGLGLLYNPGEWVLGTTTPLFAMLLGGLGLIFADIEWLGHWVSILSWIVAAWAAIALFWQAQRPLSGIVAGLLVALHPSLMISLGMETALVVALMLSSAWAWLGGRKPLAVILLALLILTRQDGALWALFLGLEVWRRERRLPWREGVSTILLTAPWFLYAQWRYGSILPNSALAKMVKSQAVGHGLFVQALWERTIVADAMPIAVALFLLALIIGMFYVLTQEQQFWWLITWTISYSLLYELLAVGGFWWYLVPPFTTLALLVALGIGFLLGDGSKTAAIPTGQPKRLVMVGFGLFLLATVLLNQWQRMEVIQQGRTGFPTYKSVGLWLADHTAKEATVATIEIGLIGYHSQRPLLDTMGLVSPEMAAHWVGWKESLVYAIEGERPDYVVTVEGTVWDWLTSQWWFEHKYQPVTTIHDTTIYQRTTLEGVTTQSEVQTAYNGGLTLNKVTFFDQHLQPDRPLSVQLGFEVHATQVADYQLTLFLLDEQSYERLAVTTIEPFDGGFATRYWLAGDKFDVPGRLSVPPELTPGTYRLGIVLYDKDKKQNLSLATDPNVTEVHTGWLRFGEPSVPPPISALIKQPIQTRWQEGIELESIAWASDPLLPGDLLSVYLFWQPTQVPSRDLTLFLHLLNSQGEIVTQRDQRPFGGRFPTTVWQPEETLVDLYELDLPEGLPEGVYSLRIGFYDEAGQLPLADGSADHLLLPNAVSVQAQ